MRTCYVYGLRLGEYVKIGCTTQPRERRSQIERLARGMKYPDDLLPGVAEPLFAVPGDRCTEQVLHLAFAADRAAGEWFHYRGAVKAWCESLRATWPQSTDLTAAFRPVPAAVDF